MTRTKTAPFVRSRVSPLAISSDLFVVLVVLLALSSLYYGWRPVLMGLLGTVTAIVASLLCSLLLSRKMLSGCGYAASFGLAVTMMLPPTAPYWMPVAGALMVGALVSVPLGRAGHSPFHPVAAGASFLSICFSAQMFAYPTARLPMINYLSLADVPAEVMTPSTAAMLKNGVTPLNTLSQAATGQVPGAIGTVFFLVLCAGALYLAGRRAIYLSSVLSFMMTIFAIGFLWPRLSSSPLNSALWEVLSGSAMYIAIFAGADRRYAPKNFMVRICFGILTAMLCMIIRYFGGFEQGACFAVLLMNVFVPLFDRKNAGLFAKGGAENAG